MTLRSWKTRAVVLALVAVVMGCQPDRQEVTQPPHGTDGPGRFSIVGALTCRADVGAQTMACTRRQLVTGELGPQFLIVGGQGTFVQLVSSAVSYNATTEVFQADVFVGNLLGDSPFGTPGVGQPLGTADGSEITGVRVFFHSGPTVTGGTGNATVRNPDGFDMFTASNQPYHEYDEMIPPGYATENKTWEWDVDNTVSTFEFEVYVEADVPHPNGFVQMSPEATMTTVGGHVTIAASVRDVVNRVGTGTITFSSSDETIATVNATTGQVTGVGPGTVNIIASSSGSEDPGVATVMIPEAGFQIRLRYLTSATPSQQHAFDSAATRWQSHLTADLSNVLLFTHEFPYCGGTPVNEVIDDLVIQVILGPIDGVGGILGQAGPCAIRSSNKLPAWGIMMFDTADLAALETDNQLVDVITHEMGHVLGFGVLWDASLLNLRVGTGTSDPRFTGSNAITAYAGLGGTGTYVPLEGTGGTGTRDAHWREASCGSCETIDYFGNELMTGYISAPGNPNPLSVVTLRQFADLGYPSVNLTGADAFTLNPTIPSGPAVRPSLHLVDDVWRGPVYQIEPDGKLTPVQPDRR
jgi:hypothetical protein